MHLCMFCHIEILHLLNFCFVDQKPFITLRQILYKGNNSSLILLIATSTKYASSLQIFCSKKACSGFNSTPSRDTVCKERQ